MAGRANPEVEAFVKMLPSIAVLVTSEEEVEPLARCLNEHLVINNIRAVPCRDGQSIGKENDVRVFDIQHIKGLEFEAVFFVGVDRQRSVGQTYTTSTSMWVPRVRQLTWV